MCDRRPNPFFCGLSVFPSCFPPTDPFDPLSRMFLDIVTRTYHQLPGRRAFFDTCLNIVYRVSSSKDGPRADFTAIVEWILARNRSPITICSDDDLARSTLDPESSPPSPCCAECKPTIDEEPETTATDEPSLHVATELTIDADPELFMVSDQVRKLTTMLTHFTMAEGELIVNPELDLWADLPLLLCWSLLSVLSPRQAQRGLPFPCLAQGGPQIPNQTQRGLEFPRPAREYIFFFCS